MKLLITGRNGQVARSLAERGVNHEGIELHFAARPEVDLERPGAVADVIAEIHPDVVVNAAAYTDVDRAEDEPERATRVNAEAAGEAATAAAALGVPIIQLSTDYVFDGRSDRPYREGEPTGPLNVYGASKLAGEERVRAANDRHLILRTSWLVGPFGRNFVKIMLRLAKERDEISVVADQIGSPTGTLMLADAILSVVERWRADAGLGLGQTFHVAGKGACSWADLATEVMRVSAAAGGDSSRIVPIASSDYPTKARRPMFTALNTDRFDRTFAFQPEPWQSMVARTVERLVGDENAVAQQ